MAKKLAFVVVGLALMVVALYAAGYRLALDGSGSRPRFFSKTDYDALEADRARQRERQAADGGGAIRHASAQTAPRAPTAPLAPVAPTAPVAPLAPLAPPAPVAPAAPEWSDFRGPHRDGRYRAGSIRTTWPRDGLPRMWKQPVGGGYASFVVVEGRAFTIEQRRDQEVVAAYDAQSGRELWTNGWKASFEESMGGDGPRATPTYHEGRVYALGAQGELRVLDARTGALVWRRNILVENQAQNLTWGMSASPLIVDDKAIVLPGGTRGNSVVAYHKATGEVVWRSLNDEQGYTSPMLVTLGGVRQILVVSASRAMGLTVEGGQVLWEHPWVTFNGINVSQPIVFQHNGKDRVFLSASYGTGAVVLELIRTGDRFVVNTVWQNQRMKNKFSSSVFHDGHIYGLDESILACLDANTGEQRWKGGRYGYGQILLAGDHLVALTEDGEVVLVRATPERHEEVAKFEAIRGKTWNHPVIAGGRLLVRNSEEMAAFDIRP